MKVLTKQQIRDWKLTQELAQQYEEVITDRIEEVLNTFWGAFGAKVNYWYFDGAEEGEVGDLASYMNDDEIYNIVVGTVHLDSRAGSLVQPPPGNDGPYNHVILDKDGNEFGWEGSIPTRWLFEDCTDEIVKGKQAFEEKKALQEKKKAEVKQQLKSQQDKLVNDALVKLSGEEVLALEKAFKKSKKVAKK